MVNNYPLISVVIPSYNTLPYLGQCIENILQGTYKNIEIIVVDDGSTDDSAIVAGKYDIQLIEQSQQGVSAARNAGIKAATGEYLHFMDADDMVGLHFYEDMVGAIIQFGADIACCGVIDERNPKRSTFYNDKLLVSNIEDKIDVTKVGELGYCWKYLFRTSFLRESGLLFDTSLDLAEDQVFSIQAVYYAKTLVTVPTAFYHYKKRCSSVLADFHRKSKRARNQALHQAWLFKVAFADKHGLPRLDKAVYEWTRYRFLGMPLLKKRVSEAGSVKWYLLGVCILQSKKIET